MTSKRVELAIHEEGGTFYATVQIPGRPAVRIECVPFNSEDEAVHVIAITLGALFDGEIPGMGRRGRFASGDRG